jgi:hypothetical protein
VAVIAQNSSCFRGNQASRLIKWTNLYRYHRMAHDLTNSRLLEALLWIAHSLAAVGEAVQVVSDDEAAALSMGGKRQAR